MATFKNLKELSKFIKSSSGSQAVLADANVRRDLQNEMDRLQRYLIEEMNDHYESYSPEYYQRTGAWLESIRVNPIEKIGNSYSMSLTFDDNFAYHPSVVNGDRNGYIPWLLEVGWKSHSYSTPHFDGFKGTHYIRNAVDRWNKNNKFGFVIRVFHGNEQYI